MPQEQKRCPHCKGATSCQCSSCGNEITFTMPSGQKQSTWKEGICKVCKGKGTVPNKGS